MEIINHFARLSKPPYQSDTYTLNRRGFKREHLGVQNMKRKYNKTNIYSTNVNYISSTQNSVTKL